MKDEEIVALYWQRNEDAIQETSQKYGAYLTKIAHNVLSNPEDSEECVNDTYWKAWNSMPTHKPTVLSSYLDRITRQLATENGGSYTTVTGHVKNRCVRASTVPDRRQKNHTRRDSNSH